MDKNYWKQYEADLIKGYMLGLMATKGIGSYDLEVGLSNAKFHAREMVDKVRKHLKVV